ncbi:MAG: hypothetical protein WCL10_03475 [Novosphingobium sp.]|uniref:hypothetical protein n=1 Tax=Novosphingobium sp. TaxID=1874826 RepID=UPI00301796CE
MARLLSLFTPLRAALLSALLVLPACMASSQLAAQTGGGLGPAAEDQVTFAQITDNRPLDLSQTGSEVGFIWSGWGPRGRGDRATRGSFYYPMDRDLDKTHTMDWYKANHPDWAVYKCDKTSPAPIFVYDWGFNTPLDVTSPAVRDYVINEHIAPAIAEGRRVIALDNVSLNNDSNRCGVWRDGQWVQLYSGEKQDPKYTEAVFDYLGWLSREIHARGGMLALNAKVNFVSPEQTQRLVALGDVWLEEAAFTRNCQNRVTDDYWNTKFKLSRWAAERMPWIDSDKSCASPAALDADEAQWIVGNFLLMRGSRSYLSVIHDGDGKGVISYPAALNPPVGKPSGEPFAIEGGGWARKYERGLVVVNPSSKAGLRYDLPAGEWTDAGGQPVSGELALAPASARVLIAR